MATYIIVAIIAYLLGSLNISIILSTKIAGFDLRDKGSKSTGTTNVLRLLGKKSAAITLLFDVLKGVVSVLIALIIGKIVKDIDNILLLQIAGIFAVIGHTFPIFLGFKGGKGVATSLGIVMMINWKIGLICLVFALAIMAISKMVSMGSIGAAILFPILTFFINTNYTIEAKGIKYFIFSLILAGIVIFNHRENIKRIANGNENKLDLKSKKN